MNVEFGHTVSTDPNTVDSLDGKDKGTLFNDM